MKKYIWALIMIVILAVIFIFSNQQVSVSYKVSSNVTQTINETVTNYVELDKWTAVRTWLWRNNRKIAHVILYMLLGISAFEFFGSIGLSNKKRNIFLVLFCFAVSCLDELHQSFVPGRTGSVKDVLIDMIGCVIVIVVCFIFRFIKRYLRKIKK